MRITCRMRGQIERAVVAYLTATAFSVAVWAALVATVLALSEWRF